MSRSVQLAGTQRLVLCAHQARQVVHLVVTFGKHRRPADFLRELAFPGGGQRLSAVKTSVRQDAPSLQLNLGLTFTGIEELRLPGRVPVASLLRAKAPAFAEGAQRRAPTQLGDTGPSAPGSWDEAFDLATAHALVTLHAAKPETDELDAELARIHGLAEENEVRVRVAGRGRGLGDDPRVQRVHFGYRDGLSRVYLRGWHSGEPPRVDEKDPPHDWHALGEVLLGHAQNSGANPWALASVPEPVRRVFRDGSFGVFRKIEQDEHAFRRFVDDATAELDRVTTSGVGQRQREYVMAKLCGRWPDGQPVLPEHRPTAKPVNDPMAGFDYTQDASGFGCPFGAHTRRLNPRGGRELAHSGRRRPLVRRGMPYGDPFDPQEDRHTVRRGLLGLFFCASIEDQFEHLLGQWADRVPLGSPDRGNAKDPLVGQHEDPAARFSVPLQARFCGDPRVLQFTGMKAFLRTRGTMYLLYPSVAGLQQLVSDTARWTDTGDASE